MRWLVLLASLAVVLLASSVGVTAGSFIDLESSSGNTFQAWASNLWRQTTQADFDAGVLTNVATTSSPGDGNVILAVKSDWYNTNWQYRRAITIDHTKVQDVANPSTTYANFPVLVYATGLSNIEANGADIRFTSSDGITELSREIERYSGGTLYAWVKVTLTKDAGDTSNDVIYMYYGNAAATEPAPGSTYGSRNVWDSNYKGIWHFPNGATLSASDSTANGYNGTITGVTATAGQINGAANFDAAGDLINCGTMGDTVLTENGAVTFSAWIKPNSIGIGGVSGRIIQRASGTLGPFLNLTATSTTSFNVDGATDLQRTASNGSITLSQWQHIALTWDGSTTATNAHIYINGSEVSYQTTTNMVTPVNNSTENLIIGNNGVASRAFDGIIDEARISNNVRSLAWIKTEYNNQSSPSTFYSLGSEEGMYVSSGTIASQVLNTGVSGARWNALFWDKTLQTNTNITFDVRASNTSFAKDTPPETLPWTSVGGTSPVTSGLPSGRYKQWRATLTASDTSKTPTLHEVRVYYYY
jgi:hypothetical protein